MKHLLSLSLGVLLCLSFAQSRQVSINTISLSNEDIYALELYYQVSIADGEYWYDPFSGLVGRVGGPSIGQMLPNLPLGELSFDASGGLTQVVLNGRALHPEELTYLSTLFGTINPGYYWLDAQGNIGFEGGAYIANLVAVVQSQNNAYVNRGLFGNMGSDGSCSYFMDSETGSSVMTGC